ncbi:MAG TPA: amidohydrolase family protein, partial [Thermomicrobiaceae bacterium]|nr:amidohydrolase family protein [Thermomicrobiaceae bacterium]
SQLAKDAGLEASYDDYLFSQADCYPPADWAKLTGLPVRPILRIETQAEQLLTSGVGDWTSFRKAFTDALDASVKSGAIAFKSIAAYRSGLALDQPDDSAVAAALDEAKRSVEQGEHFRLSALPLVAGLVWATFEYAAAASKPMPVQFHVGLGDDDVYLPSSNPALMRPLFREPRFHDVPVVLLHNYPYVRDAAYLANIYSNVYLDLGLTLPLAGYDAVPLIRQALGLAPVTKILASSDGHAMPEFQWFAIHHWRRALTEVLNGAISDGWVDGTNEAVEIAKGVLAGNAQRIYTAQPPAAAKPAG